MLHMFSNDIYTDFRTAYKHVLIPSYVIRVIYWNQNVTKLNIKINRSRSTFEIEPSRIILQSFFPIPPFQNLVLNVVPLERGGGWYCVGFFLIYFSYIRLSILKPIFHSHNRIFRLYKSLKATYTFSHKINLTCLTANKSNKTYFW